MLVGVGGSGRQSLTRLAAYIVGEYKCATIEITRGYNMDTWHVDIKKVLMLAGAKNQPVVFIFSDSQIVKVRPLFCLFLFVVAIHCLIMMCFRHLFFLFASLLFH